MNKSNLHPKKTLCSVLLVLLLSAMGMTKMYAENIVFADTIVKGLCVDNWDTDGDGELSYAEATAVTNLSSVFQNKYTITSFDELQYFTGLTSINDYEFYYCRSLTSITIPNTVTSIGEYAIAYCESLPSIFIPASVNSIKNNSFYNCNGVEQIIVDPANTVFDSRNECNAIIVTSSNTLRLGCKNTVIPNTVTSIGENAFYSCSGLTSITIPNSVTTIGKNAFRFCRNLTSLSIGTSVRTIGEYAFHSCSGLTSVTLPNSLWYIKTYAFEYCSGLTSLTIPSSVISIESSAFTGCTSLGQITVESGNPYYDSRNNCNAIIRKSTNKLIAGCKNTVIPNTVTSIGEDAFRQCKSLTSIEIPNSVTTIEGYAFSLCDSLTSIVIPNSVTSLGRAVFMHCDGLTSVVLPNTITSIPYGLFFSCDGLTTIEIPNTVTSIGDEAFRYCESLTGNLTIPNSVTFIDHEAFSDCYNLTSLTIGNSLASIGYAAFAGCSGLTSITIDAETPPVIEDEYYYYEPNYDNEVFAYVPKGIPVNVPCGTTAAYKSSFGWSEFTNYHEDGNCLISFADTIVKNLCVSAWDTDNDGELSVSEAAAVTDIGTTFQSNGDITSFNELYYFTGLTSIGNHAFDSCIGLTSILIPNSIVSIGDEAFHSCNSLSSITIPKATSSIGELAFAYCSSLEQITVESGNTSYDSRSDCNAIIESATGVLLTGCSNTVVPGSVTSIADCAFAGCNGLTSVSISSSITSIGDNAFFSCSGLISMKVPAMEPPMLGNNTFDGVDKSIPVYVPLGAMSVYMSTPGWDEFTNYQDIGPMFIDFVDYNTKYMCLEYWDTNGDYELSYDEAAAVTEFGYYDYYFHDFIQYFDEFQFFTGLTSIENHAFSGCYNLKSITLPNTIVSIGYEAFSYCNGLTFIAIPNSVASIGDWAFYNCNGLTSISLNTLDSIGDGAFGYCFGLTSITIPNSMTYIGGWAFIGCSGLEEIVVEQGNVNYDSRNNCNAIIETSSNTLILGCKNTIIPNDVTSIRYNAFYNCSELSTITIPKYVTSIGSYAFGDCIGLASITVLAETPPALDSTVFYNVDKSIPVYIPCGTMSEYSEASGWSQFTNYQEIFPYELSVSSSNMEMGTASIVQEPDCGTDAIIQAVPVGDYHFLNWTENGEIVSIEPTYTFSMTDNHDFVANFGEITNHWTPNENVFEDNMTLTCVVQVDGVEQRTTMLELGAFCGEECRGSQLATYFAPTDRYIFQMVVFGESNEMISFRLYDHQQQQELLLTSPANITFNSNGYGSLIEPCVLNFTSTVTHAQALNSGWNWWSTYVELDNNDGLSQLENSIGNAGVIIKSRTNGYVEAYEYNGGTYWYGTLNSINNEQMYKVRTNAACNATVAGVLAVPANHPITIKSGWNWIGFTCNQNVSVDVAMSDFTPENNDVIKGRTGFTTYYSDGNYNMWYGTLTTLEVGKGYMYRSNSTTQKTLVFQTGRGETATENITTENNVFQPSDENFADNMTLTAVVDFDGEELRSEEYELAAFVGDECRGSVRLMYVEPVNRFVAFLSVFGEPSETLRFRLTDGTQIKLSTEEIVFEADGMVGTLSEPVTLRFGMTKIDENELSKVLVYPNPSNGVFNIQGQSVRKIEVFNAFGQIIVSEEISNDHLQIDLSRCADGCYMLRVVTDNGITNSQLIKR